MRPSKSIKLRDRVGNITIGFLDCLLGLAEGFAIMVDRKKVYQAAYGYFESELTVENIRRHFYSLRRRKYLEVSKKDGIESYRFTNKAKLALLDKLVKPLAEDKYYHFVSFDIPERLRQNRDAFRRAIKRMGFVEVQKSLWVCKKSVGEYVEMAASEYGVSDYVVYLITLTNNIEQELAYRI